MALFNLLFSTFLFQRSSIYYLFVAGQSSAVTAESSNNEYIITQEERGHWMLSLLHSWITVTAAFYLLYHRKKNSNVFNEWWTPQNKELPNYVALISFSSSYYIIDTMFILNDAGYLIHHGITVLSFSISGCTGKYVQLVMFHLFFAEIGNIAFISEHVFYKDGAWGIYVTTWFAMTRILWIVMIVNYQWRPMFFSKKYPSWKCLDVMIFVPSLLLCGGSLTYSFLFLQHELGYGMGSEYSNYIVVE